MNYRFLVLIICCTSLFSEPIYSKNIIYTSTLSSNWYPQDASALTKDINTFFTQAKHHFNVSLKPNSPRIIIAPHAGYKYSGLCAAAVYRPLLSKTGKRNTHFTRVIILAPSHHVPFEGITLPYFSTYKTVLGSIPIDEEAITILNKNTAFHKDTASNSVFKVEHSLEVQLPFLQKTISKFKLVPLIVGKIKEQTLNSIVEGLIPIVDNKTLIVISSDFVHHGASFDYQKFNTHILDQVRQIDSAIINSIIQQSRSSFETIIKETQATVCGKEPISIVLALIEKKIIPDVESRLTCYYTSPQKEVFERNGVKAFFEPTPDKDAQQSVSYVGMIFTTEKRLSLPLCERLTDYEKKALLAFARRIITNQLETEENRLPVQLLLPIKSQGLMTKSGAFVTLQTKNSHDLRGCIGRILPENSLIFTVQEMSKAAAFHDSRFEPVTKQEMESLTIDISVLEKPFSIKSWKDIQLGKHGIILKKQNTSAVFLPQVATEQGWNINTTLEHLAQKAGLHADAWKENDAQFEVFEGCEIKETVFAYLPLSSAAA